MLRRLAPDAEPFESPAVTADGIVASTRPVAQIVTDVTSDHIGVKVLRQHGVDDFHDLTSRTKASPRHTDPLAAPADLNAPPSRSNARRMAAATLRDFNENLPVSRKEAEPRQAGIGQRT